MSGHKPTAVLPQGHTSLVSTPDETLQLCGIGANWKQEEGDIIGVRQPWKCRRAAWGRNKEGAHSTFRTITKF